MRRSDKTKQRLIKIKHLEEERDIELAKIEKMAIECGVMDYELYKASIEESYNRKINRLKK